MFEYKLAHLVDGANAVPITLPLRISPRKQTMAAQNHAFGTGVLPNCPFELQPKFKPRTLPRQPDDLSPELPVEFFELRLPIGARCQRDRPIRMQMVHVVEGQKSVQGRVNGG